MWGGGKEMGARMGLVWGEGLAANIRRHYPAATLYAVTAHHDLDGLSGKQLVERGLEVQMRAVSLHGSSSILRRLGRSTFCIP